MGKRSEQGKRRRALLLASLMLAGGAAQAAGDNATLAVSATVMARTGCLFVNNGSPTPLDFGPLDQASTANAIANAQVTIRCRGNFWVTWTLSADTGLNPAGSQRRLRNDVMPTELMPYNLSLSSTGATWLLFWTGRSATINITGTITPANFQSVAPGDYSDTVRLTLSF